MQPILEVHNLSKKFHIQHEKQSYLSLRDSISNFFQKHFSNIQQATSEEFWALKDVSFKVYPGESIGIIGKNGAGKSTLLKILSKITPPTKGKIISRGRIASLLEVGTGFHPELSGRENIFLNGSILGMKKKEIIKRFDEIVGFSEVENFLDTPLKHYSSGMQLRLAFSVSAFLEPEILVIDEVLAVGDYMFQAKCIKKMTDICKEGKTILFVSHNFQALKSLCKKGILLEKGNLNFTGEISDAINTYNSDSKISGTEISLTDCKRIKTRGEYSPELQFDKLIFQDKKIFSGEKTLFKIILLNTAPGKVFSNLDLGINIYDHNNTCLIHLCNRFIQKYFQINGELKTEFELTFDNNLKPGHYSLSLYLQANHIVQDEIPNCIEFQIEDGNPYGFYDTKSIQGIVFPSFDISKI